MKIRIMFTGLYIACIWALVPAAYAQHILGNEMTDKNSILLRTNELSGVVVRNTNERPWITGLASSGKPPSSYGILQEVEAEGVKARIHYAEFDSYDAARRATEFYIDSISLIFVNGMWDGAKHESIGDQTWHALGPSTLAVLVRTGKTCILISCRDGDIVAQARIAEKLAERLVMKEQQGARVPVSEILQ